MILTISELIDRALLLAQCAPEHVLYNIVRSTSILNTRSNSLLLRFKMQPLLTGGVQLYSAVPGGPESHFGLLLFPTAGRFWIPSLSSAVVCLRVFHTRIWYPFAIHGHASCNDYVSTSTLVRTE
jgi:hypothetical protein